MCSMRWGVAVKVRRSTPSRRRCEPSMKWLTVRFRDNKHVYLICLLGGFRAIYG